jgi:DNA-binding MarR family transcriptional regulator
MSHVSSATERSTERSAEAAQLRADASELYDAMTDLIRLYQFRDRDRIGYYGLTITQCYVLQLLLRRGPSTLNDLVAAMRLDKSVLSRVVDGLERKHAVRRVANPADGRSALITITRSGSTRYMKVEHHVEAEYVEVLADFSPSVRKQLVALLGRLTAALQDREVETADETA